MRKKLTRDALVALRENSHRIYGIFDFQKKKLVKVGLDFSDIELEYDISVEDEERYKLVTMEVTLF